MMQGKKKKNEEEKKKKEHIVHLKFKEGIN